MNNIDGKKELPGVKGPVCPYLKKCGGCISIGTPYEETLKKKRSEVEKLLKPYIRPEGIRGMDEPWHYRNKIHRACSYERNGKKEQHMSGIYAEGTHKIVPVKNCLIEDAAAEPVIRDLMKLARDFKIRNYDESTGNGLLRHILIRTGHVTGEMLVVLVLTNPVLPGKKHFIKALRDLHPEITTVVLNINNRHTSMILGEKETVAYGRGYIEDVLCGKRFRISPKSFYQVNSIQTEYLYRKAIEYAELEGTENVLDAYCGIGTISLAVSGLAAKVTGVESNRDAVRDAVVNAKLNGVENTHFICADAGDYMIRAASGGEKTDVLFMDPPRSGAEDAFLSAVAESAPEKIIYISCNPETLVRDLKKLTGKGYRVRKAELVDMFPWTQHVETVCLLTHKD